MKFEINEKNNGLDIHINELNGKQKELYEALQECQEGRCTCPTNQYKKLDSLDIVEEGGNITLELKAKDGETFDKSEIEKCLLYTKEQINQ